MKNLFIFIVILLGITSCYVEPYETVKDAENETTMFIYNLPKDTVLVSMDDVVLYVFDMDKNLLINVSTYDIMDSAPINVLAMFIIFMALFIAGFVVGKLAR